MELTPEIVDSGSALGGNPALIQSSGSGNMGNFELIISHSAFGGPNDLIHLFRNNDDFPKLPWAISRIFGNDFYTALTMIQSNFGTPGNLELVARFGDK